MSENTEAKVREGQEPTQAAAAKPPSLDYVEKLLDMRTSRLESCAAAVHELEVKKRAINEEARPLLCCTMPGITMR